MVALLVDKLILGETPQRDKASRQPKLAADFSRYMSDLVNSQTATLSTDDFHRPKPDTARRSFRLRPVSEPDTLPTLDARYFSWCDLQRAV